MYFNLYWTDLSPIEYMIVSKSWHQLDSVSNKFLTVEKKKKHFDEKSPRCKSTFILEKGLKDKFYLLGVCARSSPTLNKHERHKNKHRNIRAQSWKPWRVQGRTSVLGLGLTRISGLQQGICQRPDTALNIRPSTGYQVVILSYPFLLIVTFDLLYAMLVLLFFWWCII